MRCRRRVRQFFESLLFIVAFLFVAPLPHRLVFLLSRFLGRMAATHARKLRRVALANLNIAYGDELSRAEKEAIVLQSFQTFSALALEVLWLGVTTRKRVGKLVRADSSLDRVFKSSPLIVVASHIGNWEALALFGALEGKSAMGVAMPLKNAFVDRMWNRIRARTGQVMVPRSGALRTQPVGACRDRPRRRRPV